MNRTGDEIRNAVRDRYGAAAATGSSCCGKSASGGDCCASLESTSFGYTATELATLPEGADLSLGCGNPTAIANLQPGEVVLDLGSGAGIDCFLASRRVGNEGRVIGVDMTPEMVTRARGNTKSGGYDNVEFRLGEIENLPVADASVDVIISNCVLNLSPDKARVFAEAFRVLRPGGRFIVSDIVLAKALAPRLLENAVLLTGCISGAMLRDEYLASLADAGFWELEVKKQVPYAGPDQFTSLASQAGISGEDVAEIAQSVLSVLVTARKS